MAKRRPPEAGATPGREPRASYWRHEIEACSASGLSQVEFCRRQGLSLAALRWWKWKLKHSEPAMETMGSTVRPARAEVRSQPPRFLPVHVVPSSEPVARDVEPAQPRGFYELELRGGHQLRVPADFEPAVLHRLILTVEASTC